MQFHKIYIFLLFIIIQITIADSLIAQKNYKISYRHCVQSDTTKILNDTLGWQAVLIGNNKCSNYNFLRVYPKTTKQNETTSIVDNLKEMMSNTDPSKIEKGDSVIKHTIVGPGPRADSLGNMVFFNKEIDSIFTREKMPDGYVLTSEKTPVIEWAMSSDSKIILSHICNKATTYFRGRQYTAWFTKEIPIAEGPWKFKGLPGLILQIDDDKSQVKLYVEKIEYPTTEKPPVFAAIGKSITLTEYFSYKKKGVAQQIRAMQTMTQSALGSDNKQDFNIRLNIPPIYSIEKRLD